MQKILTTLLTTAMLLCMAACGSEPIADQVTGNYRCTVTEYTQYQKDNQWRDTSYVYKNDGTVTITKVDDKTVNVVLSSHHFGEGTFNNVAISDMNFVANFSGTGSVELAATHFTYDARLSGSYSLENKSISISAMLQGVSPKRIFTFNNI